MDQLSINHSFKSAHNVFLKFDIVTYSITPGDPIQICQRFYLDKHSDQFSSTLSKKYYLWSAHKVFLTGKNDLAYDPMWPKFEVNRDLMKKNIVQFFSQLGYK